MSVKKEKWFVVRRWTIIICCSLFLALAVRYFLLESFRMPSSQMANTILAGDYIWVDKTAYGLTIPIITEKIWARPVERYDIVVCKTASGVMISRCLGLPGDTLEVKAYDYYINGNRLPKSPNVILPYQYDLSSDRMVKIMMKKLQIPFRDSFDENDKKIRFLTKYEYYLLTDGLEEVVFEPYEKDSENYRICIPQNQYWMLADNVSASVDSRHFGFVDQADLVGKACLIWFSKNPLEDGLNSYRFERFFRKISQ
jgi:signal peptidase I